MSEILGHQHTGFRGGKVHWDPGPPLSVSAMEQMIEQIKEADRRKMQTEFDLLRLADQQARERGCGVLVQLGGEPFPIVAEPHRYIPFGRIYVVDVRKIYTLPGRAEWLSLSATPLRSSHDLASMRTTNLYNLVARSSAPVETPLSAS